MKGGASAPEPDPKIGEAALKQAQTGEDWLNFAQDAFKVSNERQAKLDDLTQQVTEQQLGLGQQTLDAAKKDRQRYEDTFVPIEDQFVADATNYATPERQAEAAATAKADITANAAAAKEQATRQAAAFGINPNSGRFAGIERTGDLTTALASAGAQNSARQAVRDKGLALKADVVNLGRGLPAQSAATAGLGLNAQNSAIGLNQKNQDLYNSSTGIGSAGYAGAMQGYAGEAGTLQNQYNSQLDAWRTSQSIAAQNAAGIGKAFGAIVGAIPWTSDENAKENKEALPDGAALEALEQMPVEKWKYKPGVADEGEHIGPYAQDFQRETGQGDGHSIAPQDAIGLTMRAVQDLDHKIDKVADAIGLGQQPRTASDNENGARKDRAREQPPRAVAGVGGAAKAAPRRVAEKKRAAGVATGLGGRVAA